MKEHLILGSIFAALIVWLFLSSPRFWTVLIMVGSTLLLYTLVWGHMIPLPKSIAIPLAMIIGVGMFLYFAKNLTPARAAVEGTKEVGLAVMATSMSLIVVFLPVAFMAGIVGRFMFSFGVTMAFAIAVSLLVSFTLTPMMAARYLRREDLSHEGTRDKGLYAVIEKAYMKMLDFSMAHRWVIVTAMVVVFLSMFPLFKVVDSTFLPYDDEGQFAVTVRAPEGASVDTTATILESIATRVRTLKGVENTVVTIGDDPQQTLNLGTIYVKLLDDASQRDNQYAIMDRVRRSHR